MLKHDKYVFWVLHLITCLIQELPNEMSTSRYSTEEEGTFQSDAESYIRTDDEDSMNTDTDWEESMKRWINRWMKYTGGLYHSQF